MICVYFIFVVGLVIDINPTSHFYWQNISIPQYQVILFLVNYDTHKVKDLHSNYDYPKCSCLVSWLLRQKLM